MTMWMSKLLVPVLALLPALCTGDAHDHKSGAGIRCGNFTSLEDSGNLEYHYHCVHCMFTQNCLADNSCHIGTTGDTCEKCETGKTPMSGYYRVGNTCTECPTIAWPAVSFCVYLLLFVVVCFYNGLTSSVGTKVKLLCHFLQLLVLTLHIKVAWPALILVAVGIVNLAEFNSHIAVTDCAFPTWKPKFHHYLQWLTSLMIPLLVFMFGTFIDRSMKNFLTKKKAASFKSASVHVQSQKRRSPLRRLVFLVLVTMYMPVTVSALHTYLCSDAVPAKLVLDNTKNVFLMDNDITCDTFVFQEWVIVASKYTSEVLDIGDEPKPERWRLPVMGDRWVTDGLYTLKLVNDPHRTLHFVSMLYLLIYVVAFPMLLVLFTLRQRKFHFLKSGKFMYGPAYESYKDRYCFWEVLPLVRKLASVVVTDAYPIRPFIQVAVQLGMTGVYVLVIMLLRPYRSVYWGKPLFNMHVLFEVISNLVLGLVQVAALLSLRNIVVPFLPEVAVAGIVIVLSIWVMMMFAVPWEGSGDADDDELPETSVVLGEETITLPAPVRRWIFPFFRPPRKVGPDPKFVQKVEQNKEKMEF